MGFEGAGDETHRCEEAWRDGRQNHAHFTVTRFWSVGMSARLLPLSCRITYAKIIHIQNPINMHVKHAALWTSTDQQCRPSTASSGERRSTQIRSIILFHSQIFTFREPRKLWLLFPGTLNFKYFYRMKEVMSCKNQSSTLTNPSNFCYKSFML